MIYKVNNTQIYQFGGSIKTAWNDFAEKLKSTLIIFRDKINTMNRAQKPPMKRVIGTEDVYTPGRPKNIGTLVSGYKRPPEMAKNGGDVA